MFGKDDTRENKVLTQLKYKEYKDLLEWPDSLRWHLAEQQPYPPVWHGKVARAGKHVFWHICIQAIGLALVTQICPREEGRGFYSLPWIHSGKIYRTCTVCQGGMYRYEDCRGPFSWALHPPERWESGSWRRRSPVLEQLLSAQLGLRVIRATSPQGKVAVISLDLQPARLSADMVSEGSPHVS